MKAARMKSIFLILLSFIVFSESQEVLCITKVIDIKAKESPIFDDQFNLGIKLKIDGKFSIALEHFQVAKKNAHNNGNGKAECAALLEIGLMNWNLGRMQESLQIFLETRQVASENKQESYKQLAEKSIKIHELYSRAKELREDKLNYYGS
jgi:hypothetical protein